MNNFKKYYAYGILYMGVLILTSSNASVHVYSDAEFQGMKFMDIHFQFQNNKAIQVLIILVLLIIGMVKVLLPRYKACLNLTSTWNDRISSINTHDTCIISCEDPGCTGQCERFAPGTWRHNHFGALNFNDKASSYRSCL